MKNIAITCLILAISLSAIAQDSEIITYTDNFVYSGKAIQSMPLRTKAERLSAHAGIIKPIYNDVPTQVQACISAAIDIWESMIETDKNVIIEFEYTDAAISNDIETKVIYYSLNNKAYPSALYYQYVERPDSYDTADASVRINKNSNWDYSHYEISDDSKCNLTTALLRSIGIALGFGSSLKDINGNPNFSIRRKFSVFDELIVSSDGESLTGCGNTTPYANQALNNFVQCSDGHTIYVSQKDESKKMYAPSIYEPGRSLVFLDNYNSLMHYDLQPGTMMQNVDGITTEILSQIGWQINRDKKVEIIGENIDNTGIASAYVPHKFNIINHTDSTISNIEWEFKLPLKDGSEEVVCSQKDATSFEIPKIIDENKYDININGDIYGIITLVCQINNKYVKDIYRVSLELKPRIANIVSDELPTVLEPYSLQFSVEYYGSDKFTVAVEEQYGTFVLTRTIYEPFFSTVQTDNINPYFYTWIDITVSNKYGKTVKTLELPPLNSAKRIAAEASMPNNYSHIDVYDGYGTKINTLTQYSEVKDLSSGLYILNICDKSTILKQIKYVKQ